MPMHGLADLHHTDASATATEALQRPGPPGLAPEKQECPTVTVKPEQDFQAWGAAAFSVHRL
jgi:hypothetical protein